MIRKKNKLNKRDITFYVIFFCHKTKHMSTNKDSVISVFCHHKSRVKMIFLVVFSGLVLIFAGEGYFGATVAVILAQSMSRGMQSKARGFFRHGVLGECREKI